MFYFILFAADLCYTDRIQTVNRGLMSLMISILLSEYFFFFSSRRRHTRYWRDWSSDVCSSDLSSSRWRPSRHSPTSASTTRTCSSSRWSGSADSCHARVAAPPLAVVRDGAPPRTRRRRPPRDRQQTVRRSEERRVGKECRSRWS